MNDVSQPFELTTPSSPTSIFRHVGAATAYDGRFLLTFFPF